MRCTPELVTALTKLRASNPAAWAELVATTTGFREKLVTSIIGASDFGSMKMVQGELAATEKFLEALKKAEKPVT